MNSSARKIFESLSEDLKTYYHKNSLVKLWVDAFVDGSVSRAKMYDGLTVALLKEAESQQKQLIDLYKQGRVLPAVTT